MTNHKENEVKSLKFEFTYIEFFLIGKKLNDESSKIK